MCIPFKSYIVDTSNSVGKERKNQIKAAVKFFQWSLRIFLAKFWWHYFRKRSNQRTSSLFEWTLKIFANEKFITFEETLRFLVVKFL